MHLSSTFWVFPGQCGVATGRDNLVADAIRWKEQLLLVLLLLHLQVLLRSTVHMIVQFEAATWKACVLGEYLYKEDYCFPGSTYVYWICRLFESLV